MPVKARVFGKQQSAHEQRRNVTKGDEVWGRERDVDGAVRGGAVFGSEDEIAAQARDWRRQLTWRPEVDLLAHRERGRVCQASAYTHVDRGRAKVTASAGRHSQAFGHREPGCTQQLREVQMLYAECEIDNRIGVEISQGDRARQGGTGHRRVDLGDLDRAPDPAPGAIESYGHVRRLAELRLVGGVIRQRSQARAARAQAHVETERIGAGLEVYATVRDTTIEQRVRVAPHVEQTPGVEPTCLDTPRAAHRR